MMSTVNYPPQANTGYHSLLFFTLTLSITLKRPWIFSQIGPPQLQYKQSLYLTILQQSCHIYANNITKPTVTLLTKTKETITEILMISTTNTITDITNYQLLTITTIK